MGRRLDDADVVTISVHSDELSAPLPTLCLVKTRSQLTLQKDKTLAFKIM